MCNFHYLKTEPGFLLSRSTFVMCYTFCLLYIITWGGIKPDSKKVQGIMNISSTITTTEEKSLISISHYYRVLWPRRYHMLEYLIEADSVPKVRSKFCNDELEVAFKELNNMVSSGTLLNFTDWKMLFIFPTDSSDKQLGSVLSKNNKPTSFLSSILFNSRCNYTLSFK